MSFTVSMPLGWILLLCALLGAAQGQQETPCSLCPGGAPATKPDAVLVLPGVGTFDCETLEGLIPIFFKAIDRECELVQSVSSICGCPSTLEDPCFLCDADNTPIPVNRQEAPLPFLDDFVGVEGVNCQLLWAYSQSIQSDHPQCVLGQQLTRDYCCRGDFTPPVVEPCTLCVADETFVDVIVEASTNLTCGQAQEASPILWESSDTNCQLTQVLGEAACGCGTPLEQPCTFCTDGSSVPFPDVEVVFLQEQFFGRIPTCAEVETATATFEADSEACLEAQAVSSFCGCPAAENPCDFCPGDDSITLPDHYHYNALERFDINATCAQLEFILQQFDADSDTCFLAQETNWECGCNDGFYGYLGSETLRHKRTFTWVSRSSAFLSSLGAAYIIVDFFRGDRKAVYRQLMLQQASFDGITAMAWLVGPMAAPTTNPDGNDSNLLGSRGNDRTCVAQGFFVALGYGSIFFNMALSVYYYLVVVRSWKARDLLAARKWLYGIPLAASLGVAFAGLGHYEHVWLGCYVRPRPFSESNATIYLGTVHIIIAAIVCTTMQILVYAKVRKTLRKSSAWKFQARDPSQVISTSGISAEDWASKSESSGGRTRFNFWRKSRSKDKSLELEATVFWQSISYLTAFYICWPLLAVASFTAPSQAYAFWVIVMVVAPSQGFLDFLTYVRPDWIKWRRERTERIKRAQRTLPSSQNPMTSTAQILGQSVGQSGKSHIVSGLSEDQGLSSRVVSEGKDKLSEAEGIERTSEGIDTISEAEGMNQISEALATRYSPGFSSVP